MQDPDICRKCTEYATQIKQVRRQSGRCKQSGMLMGVHAALDRIIRIDMSRQVFICRHVHTASGTYKKVQEGFKSS